MFWKKSVEEGCVCMGEGGVIAYTIKVPIASSPGHTQLFVVSREQQKAGCGLERRLLMHQPNTC